MEPGLLLSQIETDLTISKYINKESSQTTIEAETDEARSKNLKMQVTKNNEISSITISNNTQSIASHHLYLN